MSLFDNQTETPYSNRDALKDKFVPDEIVGRETEKQEYVNALQPVVNGFSPDNIFLFGPSGVGKTACTRFVLDDLREQDGMDDLTVKRINCDGMEGETTLMLEIANEFRDPDGKLATTGYKKARARDLMFEELNGDCGTILIVLDELDTLENLDTFLYQVPRAHETGKLDDDTDVGLIGISNDPRFLDNLPNDVQNTLTDVTINFSEYDAPELKEVLAHRASLAFKDTEVTPDSEHIVDSETLDPDVVPLAAAHATKNTGDARMGISLLRHAGDIARDRGQERVTTEHVNEALEQYEREKITEYVERLERTGQLVLLSLVSLHNEPSRNGQLPRTREVTGRYQQLVGMTPWDTVSSRQIRKHLSKLHNIGVTEKIEQKGGGSGTYTEHRLNYEPEVVADAVTGEITKYLDEVKPLRDIPGLVVG